MKQLKGLREVKIGCTDSQREITFLYAEEQTKNNIYTDINIFINNFMF